MISDATKALIIFILFMAVIISVWTFQSRIESEVYNRETGSNITTWEAMWTNIRVDCK